MAVQITDPAKTIERCFARIYELEQINEADANTSTAFLIPARKRQIAALKATATRVARQYLGA